MSAALQPPRRGPLFMAETVQNMAEPGTHEATMVVLETDAAGKPTIWCDPEIADLVRALNEGGVRTVASCSGHNVVPFGIVSLKDGRELLVIPDWESARIAERAVGAALAKQPAAVDDADADDTEPCESAMPDCGPAVAWDGDGIGACERCAKELGWIAPKQQGGSRA